MIPIIAANPLMRSAFSFMVLVNKGSEKAEEEVAGDGIREETEHDANHGSPPVCFLSTLCVRLQAVCLSVRGVYKHSRLFRPHVLLSVFVRGSSHCKEMLISNFIYYNITSQKYKERNC